MKRVLLFLATNLAIVVVLGIVANILGVNRFLTANGLNLGTLLGFAALIGFGGAIISLRWTSCFVQLFVIESRKALMTATVRNREAKRSMTSIRD